MSPNTDELQFLNRVSGHLMDSYKSREGVSCRDCRPVPRRDAVIRVLMDLLEVIFPGYSGEYDYYKSSLDGSIAGQLPRIYQALTIERDQALSGLSMMPGRPTQAGSMVAAARRE